MTGSRPLRKKLRKVKGYEMYTKNEFAKRRVAGWTERRRYFRSLFDQVRIEPQKDEEDRKATPVIEKD